jgi:hypothetical protein
LPTSVQVWCCVARDREFAVDDDAAEVVAETMRAFDGPMNF